MVFFTNFTVQSFKLFKTDALKHKLSHFGGDRKVPKKFHLIFEWPLKTLDLEFLLNSKIDLKRLLFEGWSMHAILFYNSWRLEETQKKLKCKCGDKYKPPFTIAVLYNDMTLFKFNSLLKFIHHLWLFILFWLLQLLN